MAHGEGKARSGGPARLQPRQQTFRLGGRAEQSEARRPPGALPDAGGVIGFEPGQRLGDAGAEEPRTLGRREVIAHDALHLGDRSAEAGDIPFGQGRQSRHQHQAAEMGRLALRKDRQAAKGVALGLAMQPRRVLIEDQQDAPGLGEIEAAEDRRGFLAGAAAAVEHDAAGGEGGDADAGACAAIEQPGDVPGIDVEAVEGGGRHADGKRELGARAEAGMRRNGALD